MHVFTVIADRPFADQPQHVRLARAINIGIQDTHRGAVGRQRERQIDRYRRFSDAALAGCNRNDIANIWQGLQAALHAVRDNIGRQLENDVVDTGRIGQYFDKVRTHCVEFPLDRKPKADRGADFSGPCRRHRYPRQITDALRQAL